MQFPSNDFSLIFSPMESKFLYFYIMSTFHYLYFISTLNSGNTNRSHRHFKCCQKATDPSRRHLPFHHSVSCISVISIPVMPYGCTQLPAFRYRLPSAGSLTVGMSGRQIAVMLFVQLSKHFSYLLSFYNSAPHSSDH